MSEEDEDHTIEEKPFAADIAKQGRAACKKCKQKCLQGELRIAKLVSSPFGSGKMKSWHHLNCLFESFLKQRQTTKRLESPDEIDGWDALGEDDQNMILSKIKECDDFFHKKFGTKPSSPIKQSKAGTSTGLLKKSPKNDITDKNKDTSISTLDVNGIKSPNSNEKNSGDLSKDHYFKQFRRLVADITNTSSYLDKTDCVKTLFTKGSDGSGFKDDIVLWCRLLLPGVVKRVYNLQSRQLIKLFSRIFLTDQNEMLEHLEQGDIGETIQKFFEDSLKAKPAKKATLTVKEVDHFLKKLSQMTKEDDQLEHFKSFITKCTSNDLKTVVRLIKGDLRMGAGAKHILEGVHPDAYEAYQASRDLESVIIKCLDKPSDDSNNKNTKKHGNIEISVMTPVLPMLAEACKSVEHAMKKCPNGMFSEIKYDGERVQVHKHGSEFKYFSRSLKPVMPHKIQHFKKYIPKAFPHAKDLILDSEILMIDTHTGKPLPFGTLGVHKKAEFRDANVCLFVFDCIFYNGENLSNKPLHYRKKVLHDNMIEIKNHIVFAEKEEIYQPEDLTKMIAKVLTLGLEGLVLKDLKSIYEPGKRHWLKVKKDYLFDGAMADSADLIVLGAWYGTGKKGGMMSVFLMGCYNPKTGRFCTVTKVHTGHDDKTLEKLQNDLDMVKIGQDMARIPSWLHCTKTMVPDFVARDPKNQPVWEITGAEFTQHDVHTADGISIRFPRVTKIRDEKNWETATSFPELQKLYKTSKDHTDVSLLMKGINTIKNEHTSNKRKSEEPNSSGESPPKKKKNDFIASESSSGKNKFNFVERNTTIEGDDLKQDHVDMKDISYLETIKKEGEEIKSEYKNPAHFHGMKVLLEDELKKKEHSYVASYISDYGGEILTEKEWRNATHVLHYRCVIREPEVNSPHSARHLFYQWVKDSVTQGSVKDYREYTVRWDPDS